MRLASIDLGTNSIHLLVVEAKRHAAFEVLAHEKEMLRIGDTVLPSRRISQRTMREIVELLRKFRLMAEQLKVDKLIGIATSAVREATNGGELIDRLEREAGVTVRIVTGREEGRLIYLAVRHFIDLRDRKACIVDIGGGSVECMVASAERLEFVESLRLGTARLRGRFIEHDPIGREERERLLAHISRTLDPVCEQARRDGPQIMVGTSGVVGHLVGVAHHRRTGALPEAFNSVTVQRKELEELRDWLETSTEAQRQKLPGVEARRQDLLLPAAYVLCRLMERMELSELIYCTGSIREGILYNYINRNRKKLILLGGARSVREQSVLALAQNCRFERVHVFKVEQLALMLFDGLAPLHGLGAPERELLRYACWLHDIGQHISYEDHQKHSYYLIKHGVLRGFNADEIELMANLARYHRKGKPKKTHVNYARLESGDRRRVQKLVAILRVADALDRSHFGVIDELRVKVNERTVVLELVSKDDPELELWAVQRKAAEFFREVYERTLECRLASTPEEAATADRVTTENAANGRVQSAASVSR